MKLSLLASTGCCLIAVGAATTGISVASTAQQPSGQCAAGVSARFIESAPRDRFTFINTSGQQWSVSKITIALSSAEGNLVFDTEDGGLGVEVFQPYRLESGSASVAGVALPADGDQLIEIEFNDFPAGADYTFSIDIDDQLPQSALGNIRVSGGEMKGTELRVEFVSDTGVRDLQKSLFNSDNRTAVTAGCT